MGNKLKIERRAGIVDLLINKAALKQDIADYSENILMQLKEVVQHELDEIAKSINDTRIRLDYKDNGKHEFRINIGSDTIVFQLHTNIFRLDDENPLWKTKYVEKNGANGYFGIINIYNFLAESVKQNRLNDVGYLIGRMFINHNEHFIMEGEGQLGTDFQDLENSKLTKDVMCQVIQSCLSFAVNFDLVTPPYKMVQEVSLQQINAISSDLQMATGKRLGFKFSSEEKDFY